MFSSSKSTLITFSLNILIDSQPKCHDSYPTWRHIWSSSVEGSDSFLSFWIKGSQYTEVVSHLKADAHMTDSRYCCHSCCISLALSVGFDHPINVQFLTKLGRIELFVKHIIHRLSNTVRFGSNQHVNSILMHVRRLVEKTTHSTLMM